MTERVNWTLEQAQFEHMTLVLRSGRTGVQFLQIARPIDDSREPPDHDVQDRPDPRQQEDRRDRGLDRLGDGRKDGFELHGPRYADHDGGGQASRLHWIVTSARQFAWQ